MNTPMNGLTPAAVVREPVQVVARSFGGVPHAEVRNMKKRTLRPSATRPVLLATPIAIMNAGAFL